MPSTIKMHPDHGEKWLPTALNYTVTRGLLTFLAAVIFIPWPLESYRYLFCHHQSDIEKNLRAELNGTVRLTRLFWPRVRHAL